MFTCKLTRALGCTEGVKVEDFTDNNIRTEKTGRRILAIKAQGLAGDVGDSLQLAVGFREMPPNLFDILLTTRQIDEVDQAFQGIIDLMGDELRPGARPTPVFPHA